MKRSLLWIAGLFLVLFGVITLLRERGPREAVTEEASKQFKGAEQDNGQPIYFEIFDWLDGAVDRAHEHPEVMAIWEPMDQLCEERGGKPSMEFPHVQKLDG